MSGFQQIRLYQNTVNTIPGSFTDITSVTSTAQSQTVNPGVLYDYNDCLKQVGSLSAGTEYWFWVECIDVEGNSSGIQSLGSITTSAPQGTPLTLTPIPSIDTVNGTTITNGGFDRLISTETYTLQAGTSIRVELDLKASTAFNRDGANFFVGFDPSFANGIYTFYPGGTTQLRGNNVNNVFPGSFHSSSEYYTHSFTYDLPNNQVIGKIEDESGTTLFEQTVAHGGLSAGQTFQARVHVFDRPIEVKGFRVYQV